MIRVLIADDHTLVREGLRSVLEQEPDIRVCGEAADAEGVFLGVGRDRPDVLVLDLGMPGPGFLEVLRRLREEHPGLRVLVVSMMPEEEYAIRVFRAGAHGFVGKDRAAEEVVEAVRRVNRGRKYVSHLLAERLVTVEERGGEGMPHEDLSAREFEVLCMLGSGVSPKEIGRRLAVSPKTVSTYRARILQKLSMQTNADIVRYCIEHRLAGGAPPV